MPTTIRATPRSIRPFIDRPSVSTRHPDTKFSRPLPGAFRYVYLRVSRRGLQRVLLLVREPRLRLHTYKHLARAIASCSNLAQFDRSEMAQKVPSFVRLVPYKSESA